MSIVSGAPINRTASESLVDKYTKEYTITYKLYSNDIQDGPNIVLNSTFLPKLGDFYGWGHDLDYVVRCTNRSVSEAGVITVDGVTKGMEWNVVCTYSTADVKERDFDDPLNPLLEAPQYSGGANAITEVFQRDIKGKALKNSAGTPFKQVERASSQAVITVVKNYPAPFDHNYVVENINDRINDDAWKGYPKKTLRIKLGSFEILKASIPNLYGVPTEINYAKVVWNIERATKEWGWKTRIINKGPKYKDSGKLKPFLDKQGQPTEGWLKANGTRFTDEEVDADSFEPTYRDFEAYDSISFSGLGI